jgi:hypothetical protein
MNKNTKIPAMAVTTLAAFALFLETADAAVYWNGTLSSDWADVNNWTGGLPSDLLAGDAVVNPGAPFVTPVLSTSAAPTVGQTYISTNAGLSVVGGGQLTTVSLVTGIWGNSNVVDISGGSLAISGTLNMGAGGFDGKINISGGSVTAGNLSINTVGGARMNLGGTGSFIAPISNLGNVNYWIANNAITVYDGAPGWSVNVDTVSQPGNLVLTAIPEPSTPLLTAVSIFGLCVMRKRRSSALGAGKANV